MSIDLNNFPSEMDLYFRRDIPINQRIILKQPTVGQILDYGEARYFSMAKNLVLIPSDIKPELQDIGIDYEEISDFELFCMLSSGMSREDTCLLLGDLDLSKFKPCINTTNNERILYDESSDTIIDRRIHLLISKYICKLHGFTQKVEHAANKFTKKILIEDDRQRKAMEAKKPYESPLLPIISSLVNSEGFKYSSKEVLDLGFYELRDSIQRISLIKQVDALQKGIYGGWIDSTKINKKDLDWTKRL